MESFPQPRPILKKSYVETSQPVPILLSDDFSKLLDMTTMSRIGGSASNSSTSEKIRVLEGQIAKLKLPEEPLSAEDIFKNKTFNEIKQKMPHLPSREIFDLIVSKWKFGISDKERAEY